MQTVPTRLKIAETKCPKAAPTHRGTNDGQPSTATNIGPFKMDKKITYWHPKSQNKDISSHHFTLCWSFQSLTWCKICRTPENNWKWPETPSTDIKTVSTSRFLTYIFCTSRTWCFGTAAKHFWNSRLSHLLCRSSFPWLLPCISWNATSLSTGVIPHAFNANTDYSRTKAI